MSDHGHNTLINYIIQQSDEDLKGKTIIEIGTVREFLDGQNSTECFIKLCIEKDMKLITVDMDEKCSNNAKTLCEKYDFSCEIITAKGEDYLKTKKSFDYIYLDGYDYDHGQHSQERQDRYNHYMSTDINNEECWQSHLSMVELLCKISNKNSVICFDDIINHEVGKGVTAIPYLNMKGWKIKNQSKTSVLFISPDAVGQSGEKHIFVLGNGASLKGFDFKYLVGREWIGTCVAFRYWEEVDIYPTHYVCVDNAVCKKHIESIKNMIINKKCETFLLCASIIQEWPDIQQHRNVIFIQQLKNIEANPFRYLADYCSGSSAVLMAYVLKANRIHLLGMDCKYIEFLPECEKLEDGTLKIIEKIKDNPNYFWNDYQQLGDIYNPPNVNRVHKTSWFDIRNILLLYNILSGEEIQLYNYNTTDILDGFFKRKTLEELPNELTTFKMTT